MKNLKRPLIIALIFLVILLAFISFGRKKSSDSTSSSKKNLLIVTTTKPTQNGSHYPFSPIEITFNRPPKENDFAVTIQPHVELNIIASEKSPTIRVLPKTAFEQLTTYRLTLSTTPPYVLQFVTDQSVSNPPGWNELFSQSFEDYRDQYGKQDDALAAIRKSTPINQRLFKIDYSYKTNGYSITLRKPYDQSKQEAFLWLNQRGITDLTTLRISWIEE